MTTNKSARRRDPEDYIPHSHCQENVKFHVRRIFRRFSYIVNIQVLTVAGIKMAVFWVAAPCSLLETVRRFRGAYCLYAVSFYDYISQKPRRHSFSAFLCCV